MSEVLSLEGNLSPLVSPLCHFFLSSIFKSGEWGTFMVVPWLRPCAPTAGGLGSIPGQGTRSHMPQLEESLCCNQRSCMLQWRSKIPCAAAKTRYSHTQRKKVENGATGKWNCFLHLKASEMIVRSDQIRSVSQSCPTLCNPMNRSTPGLPVHHQLPEFTETHVHRVSDAIQPSHPLSSPSPLAPNPS